MRYFVKSAIYTLFVVSLLSSASTGAIAQQQAKNKETIATGVGESANLPRPTDDPKASKPDAVSVEEKLRMMEKLIEQQQQEIKELRSLVEKIGATVTNAASSPVANDARVNTIAANQTPSSDEKKAPAQDETQKKIDDLYKKFGGIKLSGDIRFRAETFSNQGFDSLIEPPSRNRLRVRARLEIKSNPCKKEEPLCFDWGLKFATGNFTDNISTNQTLTDFYERKPFALERAFVKFTWKRNPVGFELTAGKFEPTFRRTQMVWDDDVNVEGASEAVYFEMPKSRLERIKVVAFELPFNEVPGGNDGLLFGGQLQTDWKFPPKFTADVNAAYYAWNQVDQVLFALGAPATQVGGGINNGSAVTGGQNGTLGTTNRLIRDARGNPIGFLANFHLFDVLGNFAWQARKRTPIKFTFDYVHNLSKRINDENNGYWMGVEVRRTNCVWSKGKWYDEEKKDDCGDPLKKEGDWLVQYTFTRIDQDAVLVPFNFSDILASNSRAHIPTLAYVPVDNVILQWTGLFSRRVNKIVPLSPVNRWLNRMQFDVIYKF